MHLIRGPDKELITWAEEDVLFFTGPFPELMIAVACTPLLGANIWSKFPLGLGHKLAASLGARIDHTLDPTMI
jgi:hypothetical protein